MHFAMNQIPAMRNESTDSFFHLFIDLIDRKEFENSTSIVFRYLLSYDNENFKFQKAQ